MKEKRYKYIGDAPFRVVLHDGRTRDLYRGDTVTTKDGKVFYIPNSGCFDLSDKYLFNFERQYIEEEIKHWESLREQAAIAAMQGLLAGTDNKIQPVEFWEGVCLAQQSIKFADALIEELKEDQ